MPILRKKSVASANPNNRSNNEQTQTSQTQNKSQYEQSREERIKENLERMKKLGIVDISLQLKSNFQPKRTAPKTFSNRSTTPSPFREPGRLRRSSRLQNATPVSYSEMYLTKKDKALDKEGIMLEEGAKPEIYTEEHEKLLGNTDKSWTLFVDGYGKDGKRIYDQVRGKTCHQCRQKTLGHHTHCSQCDKVQGQFCGDCLYMSRYGEHVIEAIQNPDWICPVCRGICNCSFCRTAKGWPPTGVLYKKITQLGFKSVAHYLIQTQRSQKNLGENPETTNQVSAKRSLHFPDVDASCEEILKDHCNDIVMIKPLAEHKIDDELKSEKENDTQSSSNPDINNQTSAKRSLSFPDVVQQSENFGSPELDHKVGDHLGLPKLQSESSRDDLKGEKENEIHLMDMKLGDSSHETSSKHKMKPALAIEPCSIAGRLRQRRRKGNDHDDDLPEAKVETPDVEQELNKILSETEVEKGKGILFTDGGDSSTALGTSSKLKKKRALAAEPSPDSIAGRLRQRRKANSPDGANTLSHSTPT
ncbi:unnamed protein product [Prunus brigantina]